MTQTGKFLDESKSIDEFFMMTNWWKKCNTENAKCVYVGARICVFGTKKYKVGKEMAISNEAVEVNMAINIKDMIFIHRIYVLTVKDEKKIKVKKACITLEF